MDLILGYIAGLLTLINPCVLPVLPIVLASALQAGRYGPLAIAAGLCLSFVTFGMLVATIGHSIGLTEQVLAQVGAILMIAFGFVLLIPRLNLSFATATTSFSSSADGVLASLPVTSLRNHFLGGILLGAVWSPCIGPTLGGAISLASQGKDLGWAFLIMLSFGLGISSVVVGLGYGTGEAIRQRKEKLRGLAEQAKPILGVTFVLVGLMVFFKIHHLIEGWMVGVLPLWLQDLSIRY